MWLVNKSDFIHILPGLMNAGALMVRTLDYLSSVGGIIIYEEMKRRWVSHQQHGREICPENLEKLIRTQLRTSKCRNI
jgi:hypothetical protein